MKLITVNFQLSSGITHFVSFKFQLDSSCGLCSWSSTIILSQAQQIDLHIHHSQLLIELQPLERMVKTPEDSKA